MSVTAIAVVGRGAEASSLQARLESAGFVVAPIIAEADLASLAECDLVVYCEGADKLPDPSRLQRIEAFMTPGSILMAVGRNLEAEAISESLLRPDQFVVLEMVEEGPCPVRATDGTAPGVLLATDRLLNRLRVGPVRAGPGSPSSPAGANASA